MPVVHKVIFKNVVWLSVSEVINSVLLYLFTVLVAKYLGAEKYGQISFALSASTLFAVLIDFGLGVFTIREVSRHIELSKKYFSAIFSLRLVLSVFYIGLMFLIAAISHKGAVVVYLVMLTAIYMVIYNLTQACVAIYRSQEKMNFEAISKVLYSIILFGGGLLVTWKTLDLVYFGWVYVFASFAALIYSLIVLHKYFVKISFSFDYKFWQYLIKQSWPFTLSLVFVNIYYFMDSFLLGLLSGDKEVGWYNAGYKIVFFVLLFANVFVGVFFPVISKLYKESVARLKLLLGNFSKLMIIIAVPLGFGVTIIGPKLLVFIFGEDFSGGGLAFQILMWGAAVTYLNTVYGNSLQACDRQKTYAKGVGLGAAVNLILNLILIPFYSLNGSAAATLVTALVLLFYMYFKFRKIVSVKFTPYLLKPVLAAIGMGIFLYVFRNMNILLILFGGIVIYFVLLLITGGITRQEISFYRSLMKKQEKADELQKI
ncbi:MAG: flippase [Patescibacteria group bacterium]|jgi:O-antigen/teichoic acid export membrane protein